MSCCRSCFIHKTFLGVTLTTVSVSFIDHLFVPKQFSFTVAAVCLGRIVLFIGAENVSPLHLLFVHLFNCLLPERACNDGLSGI